MDLEVSGKREHERMSSRKYITYINYRQNPHRKEKQEKQHTE